MYGPARTALHCNSEQWLPGRTIESMVIVCTMYSRMMTSSSQCGYCQLELPVNFVQDSMS